MNLKKRLNFIKQYFQNAICISVLIFISAIYNCPIANAQIKFSASAPNSVPENQNFKIKFSLENGLATEFSFLANADFEIIGSPTIETTTQIINGVTTHYETHTYLLHPVKQGKLIIPGPTITVNGAQMKSNDIEILVTKPAYKKRKEGTNSKYRKKQQKKIDKLFKLDDKRN